MEFIIPYILGMIVGVIVMLIVVKWLSPKTVGYLRVDHSDPDDGPYLFLELSAPLDFVAEQDTVNLNVKLEDYIPRE